MAHGALRSAIAGAVITALGALSRSSAAVPKLQGVGEASVGYTDNVRTTPDSAGGEPRSRGAFSMLSPGVVLSLESPRQLQRVGYRFEYDLYFTETAASSSSNRLDYRGFFDLSPRFWLVLGANVNQSDRFSSVSFSAPGTGLVGAVPAQGGAFLQGNADESLGVDLSEGWRGWQRLGASGDVPIFDGVGPRSVAFDGRLGIERAFEYDAAGLEARGDYSIVKGGTHADGSPAGRQRQAIVGGVAQWRHDWGRYLSSSAEAGALRVYRLDSGHGFWSPTAAAMLGYAEEQGDAQLSYAHTVTTNTLIGQSLIVDEVRLRGALPLLPEGVLTLAASTGYQHGRLIDDTERLQADLAVDVFLIDVALGWQVTKHLELGLRFQHVRQASDAETPPLPLSFVQNNALLGAALRFPAERDMPKPYRAPRRVDRADEIREGVRTPAQGPRAPGELMR